MTNNHPTGEADCASPVQPDQIRAFGGGGSVSGPVAWRFYSTGSATFNDHWTAWSADMSFRELCEKLGFKAEFAYPAESLKRELAELRAKGYQLPDGWVAAPERVLELCSEIYVEDRHDDNGPGCVVCPACSGDSVMKWKDGLRLDSDSDVVHDADCPAVFARRFFSARPNLNPEDRTDVE